MQEDLPERFVYLVFVRAQPFGCPILRNGLLLLLAEVKSLGFELVCLPGIRVRRVQLIEARVRQAEIAPVQPIDRFRASFILLEGGGERVRSRLFLPYLR